MIIVFSIASIKLFFLKASFNCFFLIVGNTCVKIENVARSCMKYSDVVLIFCFKATILKQNFFYFTLQILKASYRFKN